MTIPFEVELEKLKNTIIKIADLAEQQVTEATATLLAESKPENKVIKRTEDKIDKLDVKIDQICQKIFALKQPVASDLRFIMSAMQISNEIERIGDLSMSVVKKTKKINDKHDLIKRFGIDEVCKQIVAINQKANECFISRNENTIGEIFILNKSIKNKTSEAIHEIIAVMKTNSKTVVSGTHLIIVLKHLERISEHCTNIAEYVYFMINAKIIKHDKLGDIEGLEGEE
ncbi:phosphate signaling complex protein PhoU [Flavobacterium agrisoli]|uniref:Phosphate-specific transport system accessory protein PhoU n=1 Tax=Flavobacterium agrisoli TaxID=2793066 RepID=A0A934UKZ6_9FLAO|nr:phosphate signaling complex protein PhoU [Flavobacterium agrisoli]MBK0371088.1 phosphate signaling complex protein PhoU [Flavobacterium agrisoli]